MSIMIKSILKCDHCGEETDAILGNKGWILISTCGNLRFAIHRTWSDTCSQIKYVYNDVHFCSEQCLVYWMRNFDMIRE